MTNRDDPADDDRLMTLVAARDSRAFHALVERHAPLAHRIGWRMLADGVEAEDIAQETMLRLWDHAGRWQAGGSGVGAWVTRVATNLSLDRIRRRRFVSDEAVPERRDDAPLADELLEAEEQRRQTMAAIAALPDRQRAAVILTYYEGCSNLAAAAALDMNIKAFESLLPRARTALRKSLGCVRAAGEAA